VQNQLLERATAKRDSLWHKKATLTDFAEQLKEHGGFYQTGWCRDKACENALKEYSATIRCLIPQKEFKVCFRCDKPSEGDILIAKAY